MFRLGPVIERCCNRIMASCADADLLRPIRLLPNQCTQVSENKNLFQSVRNESSFGIPRTTLRQIQNTKFKNEELEDLRAVTGNQAPDETRSV